MTLWDLADRAAPRRLGQPLSGHTDRVTRVAFAPDGRTLAASDGRSVSWWDISNLIELRANPAEWACAITGRGLDPDQWVRYISGLPYQNTCP